MNLKRRSEKKLHKLFMLVVAGVILLDSCSMKDNAHTKDKKNIGSAIITLDDEQDIKFNATSNTELSLFQRTLSVGLSNQENGMVITFMMLSEDPIEGPGTYNGSIILKQQIDDMTKTQYGSHYYKDTVEELDCVLAITAISENRVQGRFSGTLYAESGKKATISEGKFDITVDHQF